MKKDTSEIIIPLKNNEKEEEIEFIWIVVSNMKWRGPVLGIQTVIGLIPIIGLVTSIFPRMEHHGIVFKTKNGNNYVTQYGGGGVSFKNYKINKNKAFNSIAEFINQKNIWVLLKAVINSDTKLKIGDISNIIEKVTPKQYNAIFENCQKFVKYIGNEIYEKIKILGYDSGWTSGHMAAGGVIYGDRSY